MSIFAHGIPGGTVVVLREEVVDEVDDAGGGVGGLEPRLETFGAQVLDAAPNVLGEVFGDPVEFVNGVVIDAGEVLDCASASGELVDQVLGDLRK